ncbi:unnamed protein product [Callosobruchus maculatus]|uniref:Secreted protein n=1 Tax=Callosobruchus maculatus TaxID=64391 RepID=A0A653DMZ7_CALMS|nr:unnamed protein product [Callosobruchus maculatus]
MCLVVVLLSFSSTSVVSDQGYLLLFDLVRSCDRAAVAARAAAATVPVGEAGALAKQLNKRGSCISSTRSSSCTGKSCSSFSSRSSTSTCGSRSSISNFSSRSTCNRRSSRSCSSRNSRSSTAAAGNSRSYSDELAVYTVVRLNKKSIYCGLLVIGWQF